MPFVAYYGLQEGRLRVHGLQRFLVLGEAFPRKSSWQRFLVKTIFRKDYMHEYMLTNQVEDNFMGIFRNTGVHACYMGYILTSIPDLWRNPSHDGIDGNRLGQASLGPSGNERQVMGTEKTSMGWPHLLKRSSCRVKMNPTVTKTPFWWGFDTGIILRGQNLPKYMGHVVFRCRYMYIYLHIYIYVCSCMYIVSYIYYVYITYCVVC